MPTPLHLISRIPVAKMQIKSDMNQRLATLSSCTRRKRMVNIRFIIFHSLTPYNCITGFKLYLWRNKFPCQQADSRQCAIGQERDGCPRVYNGVNVGKPFQKF